ncbi:MAG TPA: efflux RND transporter permease subunit, partial [Candidatus Xenobia bacterium]
MKISAWAIRHPVPCIVLFAILLVAGLFSFFTLGIDINPTYDETTIDITINMPGAAPAELESQITRPVENAVASMAGVNLITSTVSSGMSMTSLQFNFGTNMDRATSDVRNAIGLLRPTLPSGIADPFIRCETDTDASFVTYPVSSPTMSVAQLSQLVDNQLLRAVQGVKGVGRVKRDGGVDREVRVELDPVALDAMGLTCDAVNSQIRALNLNRPGGNAAVGSMVQSILTLGSAQTVEQLRTLRITLPGGKWARLDTLGTVQDTAAEPQQEALLDGKPVVGFEVSRAHGANMAEVSDGVDQALDDVKKSLPSDVHIGKVYTDVTHILEWYHGSVHTLWLGACLAVLAVFLFLRDARSAIICAFALPISVIPTFAAMKMSGFTLNSMTLVGLCLVIGILVDDAIVEVENIVRHMHLGRTPYDAAMEAADEIGLAVVATTMTIVVVFLPIGFVGGWIGLWFKPFGLTVAMAVLFSLLVARLLTPVMAAYWLKPPKHHHDDKSWALNLYQRILPWALKHRLATVLIAIVYFGIGVGFCFTIPTSVLGGGDQGSSTVQASLPPGTGLSTAVLVAQQLNQILARRAEVRNVFALVTPESCNLRVNLVPKEQRKLSQAQFEDEMRPQLFKIPGVRTQFGGDSSTDNSSSNVASVLLTSESDTDLKKMTKDLMDQMRTLPSLADVRADAALQRPEIEVIPDQALAAAQGVTTDQIANTAEIALLGDLDQNLPRFDLPDRQLSIRVELAPGYRHDMAAIRGLKLLTTSGHLIPLETVA